MCVVALRYAAVGGGSYHWVVDDGQGERRFVTVDDLDGKGWLGRSRPAVFAGPRAAMDPAVPLPPQAGLRFGPPPLPALPRRTLCPPAARHPLPPSPPPRPTPVRLGH